MRPGPKKPALAGPRLIIKNQLESTSTLRQLGWAEPVMLPHLIPISIRSACPVEVGSLVISSTSKSDAYCYQFTALSDP